MTNGEAIMKLFPQSKWWVNDRDEIFTEVPWKPEKLIVLDLDWWNNEYKGDLKNFQKV